MACDLALPLSLNRIYQELHTSELSRAPGEVKEYPHFTDVETGCQRQRLVQDNGGQDAMATNGTDCPMLRNLI